jgi:hypothetical protein
MDRSSMAPAERVKHRRALFLGLQSLLTPEQALGALYMWERDFADESPFSGIYLYTKIVCECFGKVGRRKELHAAVLDALFKKEHELPADPQEDLHTLGAQILARELSSAAQTATQASTAAVPRAALAPSKSPKEETLRPHPPALNISLALFLQAIFSELKDSSEEAHAKAVMFVCEALPRLQLPPADTAAWAHYLRIGLPGVLMTPIMPKQAANLTHLLYVWIAETLGPTRADQLLASVVRQVEQDPRARGFSVRQLL